MEADLLEVFEQQEEAAGSIAGEREWPCEGIAAQDRIAEVIEQDYRRIAAVAGKLVEADHIGCSPWEDTCCHCGMVQSYGSGHRAYSYHTHFRMRHHTVDTGVACPGFGSSLAGSCMRAVGVADTAFPGLGEHTSVAAVADLGHCAVGLVPVLLLLLLHPEAAATWEA